MGQYRIEPSPNNRATCKNKDCKDNAIKITKGEPRFGTFVEINGNQSWSYKHWGCVTPAQIQNIKDSIDGDIDMLDGYEEVSEEVQDKIRRALDQGHVDDADWRGDPEFNRPGMKGMHKRTPKKKKAAEGEEEGVDGPVEDTQSKPTSNRKGRAKKDEHDQDDEPITKKPRATKAGPKQPVKSESEDADELPKKASRARGKRAAVPEDDDAEEPPTKKAKSTSRKVKSAAVVEDVAAPSTKAKSGKAAKKGQANRQETPVSAEQAIAPKKGRKKVAAPKVESPEPAEESPEDPAPKKQRAGRKTQTKGDSGEAGGYGADDGQKQNAPKASGKKSQSKANGKPKESTSRPAKSRAAKR